MWLDGIMYFLCADPRQWALLQPSEENTNEMKDACLSYGDDRYANLRQLWMEFQK
jgi:hypothetical protein